MGIGLARLEDAGREVRLVWRIGIDLCLKAACRAEGVFLAVFSGRGAVEEVAAVELDTGLVSGDLHGAAGLRVVEGGGVAEAILFGEHPAVIVASAEGEGFVLDSDAVADGGRFGEVKRRACDRIEFSGRDQAGVCGEVVVGVEGEDVIVDGRHLIVAEIPVAMMDDVERGGFSSDGGFRFPDQFIVIGENVGDHRGEFAGVAFFAVFGNIGEFDAVAAVFGDCLA